jgi:heptaprenyl diphosphate synthase
MNIGGFLSLHHQAEILTTTGRSRASAVVSGDWRTDAARTAALASFGRDLGLAFQIADDALDLIGDPEQTGKAVGTDIRQGIYSIPVCALRRRDAAARELRELLMRLRLDDHGIARAVALVRASGTIDEVLGVACASGRRAIGRLAPLPPGRARHSLKALAKYAVARTH